MVLTEIRWSSLHWLDQLTVTLNGYWRTFLLKFGVWTCWKSGACRSHSFHFEITLDFVSQSLDLHDFAFENGILFHKDFIDSIQLCLDGKFKILYIVDDLSFEGVKLLVDFIFLSFDSFLKVVKVPFFVFEKFSKLSWEKFDFLQGLPEMFGFYGGRVGSVDGRWVIFGGDASLSVDEIRGTIAGEWRRCTHFFIDDLVYWILLISCRSSIFV